ncbi:MAG TPA: GNAT family N-acetyltransferase [Anaerolineae bacterium]|nr:GNAT family N-acetyltransferase [Anaerolineae bacterium]
MIQDTTEQHTILHDLGDGLILRRSTPADADALAEFNARIHSDAGPDQPDEWVGEWTRDLLTSDHPTFGAGDFTLVEDMRAGKIVSSLNLISQTWTYDGIPFGVGRPELVGTLPEYRNRGLVRAQFEVIHAWSAGRGERVQAITGIPWYYRQFGYEMAMDLGGGRLGFLPHIPKLKEGETEPYPIRPATESDLPFIMQVYAQAVTRYRVACLRDEALWRYEMSGRSEKNANGRRFCIIESADGEPAGFLAHAGRLWRMSFPINLYELKPGVSWLAVTPGVIRYAQVTGEAYAARDGTEPLGGFGFWLGGDHPAYHAIEDRLPRVRHPYAWYLRVPDLPGFLAHIAPSLEKRLAGSIAAGYTGELKISFYRTGLRLVVDKGRLTGIEPWTPRRGDDGVVAFPDLTFLQLVFGYRTLDELRYAFADCWVDTDEARAVLEAMFPKQSSDVWPVA